MAIRRVELKYGGNVWIVPPGRNLIEEIIGEINDEFDDRTNFFFQEIDPVTYIFRKERVFPLNDFL